MSDSHAPEPLHPDPATAASLEFEPVPRKVKRPDGWTPELQREFIRRLAETGSPQQACAEMGKNVTGIEALYKVPGAASFRSAWDNALAIGRRARGLDCGPPHLGPVPGIERRPPRGRASSRASVADGWGDEAEQPEISEEQKWELIHNIGIRFMRKVAAERQARLNGEIVAADFYLRQITFLEVIFDLSSQAMGWNAAEALRELRRGDHDLMQIVSTPIADWMDAARREWWRQEGEPERPPHPDVRFLEHHSTPDGGYSTNIDQHSYGATTPPARGYTAEEWKGMSTKEQMLARQLQFQQDADEQMQWEAKARREYDDRRGSDGSA